MAEQTGNIGFEETLWKTADKLRGSMDASEYKHVVLGLLFLKYISDKFETKHEELLTEGQGFEEDRDEYQAENIFWVPIEARWSFIMDNAKDEKVGQYIDDAMILIEKENTSLKGVLDKRYARPEIDKRRLGELIDLISNIKLHKNGEQDLLGRAYEYFLGQFSSVEGRRGGESVTPSEVSDLIARIVTKSSNIKSIYDPTLGSGSLILTVSKYANKIEQEQIKHYGQEINGKTYNLARMNLIINGIQPEKMQIKNGDTLLEDWPVDFEKDNKGVQFDAVIMDPPYSIKNWNSANLTLADSRFNSIGILPPNSKGDFAFLLHGLSHLDQNGTMAIILPYGAVFRGGVEGIICKKLLEKNQIDTIIGLPSNLLSHSGIPITVIILKKNRVLGDPLLFIDAAQSYTRKGNKNILTKNNIYKIVDRYINRKNEEGFSFLVPREEYIKWDKIPSFEKMRAKKQMQTLETQYNKYSRVVFENVIKEFNFPDKKKKFEEIENTIYISKIGSQNPVCSIQELMLRDEYYYQIVLKDTISNEYLSAMFKSDLGKLILETAKSGGLISRVDKKDLFKMIIPVPEMEVQKQIERTLEKLGILEKAINNFDKELALNPTTSIKVVDQLDQILEVLEELTDLDYIRNMIRKGESKTLEFKETFSHDVNKDSKEKYIEKASLKTIVGFLNTDGGTLLIGVNDGGMIVGIDNEINKFYKNNDRYLLNFKNAIKEKIGEVFYPFISYKIVNIENKQVLMVECVKSNQPCYFEDQEFYVRTNPATDKLTGRMALEYIRNHFEFNKL